jgi:hypothetical protein
MVIELRQYGSILGSRILGRKIMLENTKIFASCEDIVFDFRGVNHTSISFITEIVSSAHEYEKNVKAINYQNDKTRSQWEYASSLEHHN